MYYQKLIAEMSKGINPAGVEASMRLEYGTLNNLPREVFAREIQLAFDCEKEQPGYLRRIAESMGLGRDFNAWDGDCTE